MARADRGNMPRCLAILFLLFFVFFLNPKELLPEFYKYVDKNGRVHYVDSKSKIPEEYREDLTTYKEKYDHLSEEEREKRLEEDFREAEELRKKREEQAEELRRRERIAKEELLKKQKEEELAEKLRLEQIAREEYLESLQTNVTIEGNSVFVPCTLGYDKYEFEALLVLDTGCAVTTLHEDIAKQLHIKKGKRSYARVAGGGIIGVNEAKLKYIQVGPYRKEGMRVDIVEHKGPSVKQKGLLGMNFLRGLNYKIDYFNEVIKWGPLE